MRTIYTIGHWLVGYGFVLCAAGSSSASTFLGALSPAGEMAYQGSNDRLQLPTSGIPIKLAEPNKIPLELHGYKVRTAFAYWGYYHGGVVEYPLATEPDKLAVMYDSDGGAYVSVAPLRLGKVELRIVIFFEDGAMASKRVDLQVSLPERKPDSLVVSTGVSGYDRIEPVDYLDMQTTRRGLFPAAIYKNIPEPVPIDAPYVSFKVIAAPESDPPIGVDGATGTVTPLHMGHALVETSFEGVSTLTCVDVVQDAKQAPWMDCHELLPAGKSLPPRPGANDPTGLKRANTGPRN